MIPAWVGKYMSIPYRANGRDRRGVDCYGLARLILREVFNQDVPDVNPADIERAGKAAVLAQQARRGCWESMPVPRPGCVVTLRVGAFSAHVGVCVSSAQFIHILEGTAVCVESLYGPVWKDRITGFYRYTGGTHEQD